MARPGRGGVRVARTRPPLDPHHVRAVRLRPRRSPRLHGATAGGGAGRRATPGRGPPAGRGPHLSSRGRSRRCRSRPAGRRPVPRGRGVDDGPPALVGRPAAVDPRGPAGRDGPDADTVATPDPRGGPGRSRHAPAVRRASPGCGPVVRGTGRTRRRRPAGEGPPPHPAARRIGPGDTHPRGPGGGGHRPGTPRRLPLLRRGRAPGATEPTRPRGAVHPGAGRGAVRRRAGRDRLLERQTASPPDRGRPPRPHPHAVRAHPRPGRRASTRQARRALVGAGRVRYPARRLGRSARHRPDRGRARTTPTDLRGRSTRAHGLGGLPVGRPGRGSAHPDVHRPVLPHAGEPPCGQTGDPVDRGGGARRVRRVRRSRRGGYRGRRGLGPVRSVDRRARRRLSGPPHPSRVPGPVRTDPAPRLRRGDGAVRVDRGRRLGRGHRDPVAPAAGAPERRGPGGARAPAGAAAHSGRVLAVVDDDLGRK
ncbi:hypothetical protein GJR88_05134 [Dietzia sp. DQ12-45-1b]|nr:hypothetical protein GJR88_05134 [Dietzia sp. DQ12-45-1b]